MVRAVKVAFLKMVPAVSNNGVCLGTPTAFTIVVSVWEYAILIGTGRYAV